MVPLWRMPGLRSRHIDNISRYRIMRRVSEVSHFSCKAARTIFEDQNIFGFDVSMNDVCYLVIDEKFERSEVSILTVFVHVHNSFRYFQAYL